MRLFKLNHIRLIDTRVLHMSLGTSFNDYNHAMYFVHVRVGSTYLCLEHYVGKVERIVDGNALIK